MLTSLPMMAYRGPFTKTRGPPEVVCRVILGKSRDEFLRVCVVEQMRPGILVNALDQTRDLLDDAAAALQHADELALVVGDGE
jgi:hypothetical protein